MAATRRGFRFGKARAEHGSKGLDHKRPPTEALLTSLVTRVATRLDEYIRLRPEGYSDSGLLEWLGSEDAGHREVAGCLLDEAELFCNKVCG